MVARQDGHDLQQAGVRLLVSSVRGSVPNRTVLLRLFVTRDRVRGHILLCMAEVGQREV